MLDIYVVISYLNQTKIHHFNLLLLPYPFIFPSINALYELQNDIKLHQLCLVSSN